MCSHFSWQSCGILSIPFHRWGSRDAESWRGSPRFTYLGSGRAGTQTCFPNAKRLGLFHDCSQMTFWWWLRNLSIIIVYINYLEWSEPLMTDGIRSPSPWTFKSVSPEVLSSWGCRNSGSPHNQSPAISNSLQYSRFMQLCQVDILGSYIHKQEFPAQQWKRDMWHSSSRILGFHVWPKSISIN